MKMSDIDTLRHILKYCQKIERSVNRFGKSKETFLEDEDYQNSVCMNIQQIGEHTKRLTQDFNDATSCIIEWHKIKGLRNIFAHEYDSINFERVWEVVTDNLPILKEFCEIQIAQYEKTQEAKEELEIGLNMDLTL